MTDRPDPTEFGALERGSSGSSADLAVEGCPDMSAHSTDSPYSRPAEPIRENELPDQLADKKAVVGQDEAITDESIEESFPASDPPSFQPGST